MSRNKHYTIANPISLADATIVTWLVSCLVVMFVIPDFLKNDVEMFIFLGVVGVIVVNIAFILAAVYQTRFYEAFGFAPTLHLLFGYFFKDACAKREIWRKRVERVLREDAKKIREACEKEKALREEGVDTGILRSEIEQLLKSWRRKRNLARIFGFLVYESWKAYAAEIN